MISVILCAAGSGTRAGLSDNKILHELNGLPVLCYSLSAFAPFADEILIACRKEDEKTIIPLLSTFPQAKTVLGGKTRTESVYNALKFVTGDIVLIHDAARPFVTQKNIEDCIESVQQYGSGVCALPATDTTVLCEDGRILSAPARENVFTVQTPQGFYTDKLRKAYEKAKGTYTDDSSIYAEIIEPPHIFIGDRANRKLTFAEDFKPAARVGFGVDTHAFGKEQDFIILGGVKIPSKSGLVAHSDGDVLVHALMDALLSAAGLRDIGYYFPDTEPKYKNADSMKLLAEVMKLVRFEIQNVSISILAETPRLSPFIETMKQNLAAALSCENIAIAAGTNEKLGYVGEGKGITVYATVLLR